MKDDMNLMAEAMAGGQTTPDVSIVGAQGQTGNAGQNGQTGNGGVDGRNANCNWKTGCSSGSSGTNGADGGDGSGGIEGGEGGDATDAKIYIGELSGTIFVAGRGGIGGNGGYGGNGGNGGNGGGNETANSRITIKTAGPDIALATDGKLGGAAELQKSNDLRSWRKACRRAERSQRSIGDPKGNR